MDTLCNIIFQVTILNGMGVTGKIKERVRVYIIMCVKMIPLNVS